MPDDRTRVPIPTGKKINLAQLTDELGGVGLVASDTEIIVARDTTVTAGKLAAAVAAHTPDPFYGLEGDEHRLAELGAKAALPAGLSQAEEKEAIRLLVKHRR